jgi:hypothetical protein
MIMDRRALVIGSWLAKGRDDPSPQKVKSITNRWGKLFGGKEYGFRSLGSKRRKPDILHNPELAALVAIFENANDISSETELLFYFLGHSTALKDNDLLMTLGLNEQGEDRSCPLKLILDHITASTSVKNLVLILDTCHAGHAYKTLELANFNYYAMFAAGNAYAFDASFSEGVLKALEEPLKRKDQRIDRSVGGMTYRKVFESAQSHVIAYASSNGKFQNPIHFGDYISEVLREAPVVVPEGYNEFVSDRTVYGRIYRLLELVNNIRSPSFEELHAVVNGERVFLLRADETNGDQYLSTERLHDYMDFLRKAEWIIQQPSGRFRITPEGEKACNKKRWNRRLLNAIETKIFPEALSMKILDRLVSELLSDMIPATPIRIKERAGMKGISVRLDQATRVALQALPSTGRFMKGTADAIFPSERGEV